MAMAEFRKENQVGKMLNLMQAAKDNDQPITIQMSSDVFLQALDYSVELRLAAERERQKKEQEQAKQSDVISPKQAMGMINVSPATLWRYCKDGLIHKKNIGGRVYYSRKEIQALIND